MEPGIRYSSVRQYFDCCPPEALEKLEKLRNIILLAAPGAEEVISYNMPAVRLNNRILVYYAAMKHHIGFYPTASPIVAFREELKGFATSRGAVRFPLDQQIPQDLVQKIVKFRIRETELKK